MRHSLFWLLEHDPDTGESIREVHETAIAQAVEADRLGYEALWLAEHHFVPMSTVPNPAVLLAAIAARTTRLRLGPATCVLPLHDPIQVAEDYALLDELSNGRLNLGVGSGARADEFAPFGVDFEDRRALYERSLEDLRRRWSNAAHGELGPHSINVRPVQGPQPPLYIATMDEARAESVGRDGDSLMTLLSPSSSDPDGAIACVQAHARGARNANRKLDAVLMLFAHAAESEDAARETVVPALDRLLRSMTGSDEHDPTALYDSMRQNDVGLFGTPQEVSAQLERLAARGVDHVALITRFGGMSREASTRSLRLLAPDVAAISTSPSVLP